ncbi:uncharacterized protein RSE6_02819 [Rhynchosporium secalis]|uniref:BTB domain-containing protein n=1 Tax=Rhynchosporium secalis TaxID=38038 RepID=A0A1E1M173_RHYSE|nr:uncharacterized protein RSE6_02819 [Rhynchosporium secalis]
MSLSSTLETEIPSSRRIFKAASKDLLTFSGIGDLVTFIIGADKVPIQVHKKMACRYSHILETAFDSSFIEGRTQKYELESVTLSAFALLAEWIYTQKIERPPSMKCRKTTGDKSSHSIACSTSTDYVALWILAEVLLKPRLQNLAIDVIADIGTAVANKDGIILAYEETAHNSLLREIFVSQATWTSR